MKKSGEFCVYLVIVLALINGVIFHAFTCFASIIFYERHRPVAKNTSYIAAPWFDTFRKWESTLLVCADAHLKIKKVKNKRIARLSQRRTYDGLERVLPPRPSPCCSRVYFYEFQKMSDFRLALLSLNNAKKSSKWARNWAINDGPTGRRPAPKDSRYCPTRPECVFAIILVIYTSAYPWNDEGILEKWPDRVAMAGANVYQEMAPGNNLAKAPSALANFGAMKAISQLAQSTLYRQAK